MLTPIPEPDPEVEARSQPSWARLILIVISTGLALVGLLVCWDRYWGGPYWGRNKVAFNREAWLAAADDSQGSRYLMLDDLLSNGRLAGCTRTEVKELLGPTLPVGPGGAWEYYLGPEPSFVSIDSILLSVRFDDSGRVFETLTRTN